MMTQFCQAGFRVKGLGLLWGVCTLWIVRCSGESGIAA